MRVLVAFGTKRGGTEGLARAVGEGLVAAGHTVEVLNARGVRLLRDWDAVVVGGALYAWHWHKDARRFVSRHAEQLQNMPVWFFSSGPLDDSAKNAELPAPRSVRRWANLVHARTHKTFGGRLLKADKWGPLKPGDFRDLAATRAWGRGVGLELSTLPMQPRVEVPSSLSLIHRLAVGLSLFSGVTAMGGGLALVVQPQGGPGFVPLSMLQASPFRSFLIPGLVLLLVVGLGNVVASALETRRSRRSELAVLAAGATLMGWIVAQLVLLNAASWLQLVYLAIGGATLGTAWWLWRTRHRLEGLGHAHQPRRKHRSPVATTGALG